MASAHSSTAIIIGGGVIGLSTAYHLARRNFGKVILLEKESIGDGASSRAAGIITGLLWSDTGILVRKLSLSLFDELSDELAPYGYRFQNVGCLNLFDADSWREREPLLSLYDRLQAPHEVLTASEISQRWPHLTIPEEQIGLHDPLGGYSEPHEYLPALSKRVHDLGVDIRDGHTVTGLFEENGRVAGVTIEVDNQEMILEADVVISTVHVWTVQLLATIGIQFPIKAFVHQRYVTEGRASPARLPAINANPQGGYIRPAQIGQNDHRILAGFESADRMEYDVTSPDFQMSSLSAPVQYRNRMTTNLVPLVPSLQQMKWTSEKVGLISFAIDGEPILGPITKLPGLYVGISFHSGGFAYNPAAGQLLAEYVMDGKTCIDVSLFSPQRFNGKTTAAYLAAKIPQSEAIQRRH